ncbi:MAG TPA: hypothetical protein VFS34_15515 [Thermoanaerobaculia bacterium]|nr:hypothetical protein [Thermoanaerobaculia bacterium]
MTKLRLLSALLVAFAAFPAFARRPAAPPAPSASPAEAEPSDFFANVKIRNLGPSVGGGRVSCVAGIPGDRNVYYVGAAGGGIWKTIDGGLSWKAVFEKEATASIGAIAVAPSNPAVVWVGTGEANIRNDALPGRGIYVSGDAGQSWKRAGLEHAGQISNIVIHPTNPDVVWVSVFGHEWGPNPDRGVFRTTDGGATWKKVLFVDDKTGAIDLVMEPGNPRVLYAALWEARRYPWELVSGGGGSGIYRSTDGGDTWKKLTKGLPDGPFGRIAIAAAPSDPRHVYALIEAKKGMLWDSTDRGDEWKKVSESHLLDVRPFYFSRLFVSPEDERRVYFLSFDLVQSDDGGKTARPIDRGVHVDHHALWIDPSDPARMVQGNDGGAYVSEDRGKSWRYWNNIPIEQFYMVAADSQTPYHLCGGLQDNNAWCGTSDSLSRSGITGADWYVTTGGDGEYAVPAPSDPTIVYSDSQNGSISRLDTKTHVSRYVQPYLLGVEDRTPSELRYRFNWTSPIAVSASDANEVYLGGNVVFRSKDGGEHWEAASPDLTRNDKAKQVASGGPINLDLSGAETYDTLLSITIADRDPGTIWTGSDDGLVHVTRDGGKTWTNVTPKGAPAWARVYQIGVSPFDPASAYAPFDAHELDDDRPYAWKTADGGKTWTSIAAGLPPDEPVFVIRENPNRRGFLVAGTGAGVYVSRDAGGHWEKLRADMPTAAVFDVKFVRRDLVVATHGRGLFVLDAISPLEEATPAVEAEDFHLFDTQPGVLYHLWNRGGFSRDLGAAPNPPSGVRVDYSLKSEIKSDDEKEEPGPGPKKTPVRIVVTDAAGRAVATRYGPSKAGLNRWVWDMRYDGETPVAFQKRPPPNEFFSPGEGPRVLPGEYTVAVTVRGKTEKKTARVEPDPRIPPRADAAREGARAALEARNELTALNEALNRTHDLRGELKKTERLGRDEGSPEKPPRFPKAAAAAKALEAKLAAWQDSVYNSERQYDVGADSIHFHSRLHDSYESLARQLSFMGDAAPTDAAREEITRLRGELDSRLAEFNRIVAEDVAGYDRTAAAEGAPTVWGGEAVKVEPPPL